MRLPRNAETWLPGYIRSRLRLHPCCAARVWLTIADHFEPLWRRKDENIARERVAAWRRHWPEIAGRHYDDSGQRPQYTFFYPEDEYRPALLDELAELKRAGIADVEIHIHHDGEGRQNFIDRISRFKEDLACKHGLLHRESGATVFGFIHGNWALDNSRPDGRGCGLNDEITLLRKLGCYADFTMPCGALPMQARMVNTIYWAIDDPAKPKSYDSGIPFGTSSNVTDGLLLIPGPFGLRWGERLIPRLEIGELGAHVPVSRARVRRWLDLAPRIGSDVFVKLFTHGAQEWHTPYLLGSGLDDLFSMMRAECERRGLRLYYASAWDTYRAVLSAGGVRGES